jgi:hypothetical protein
MAAAAWLAFGLHMAQPAHAAGRTTWMWTESTMASALRVDYAYDPSVADPNDPWHYELTDVECRGYGDFIGDETARHFQRFTCTMTYVATDPTIPNYVDHVGARVTGRFDHQEYDPSSSPPAPRRLDRPQRSLLGYADWGQVDGDDLLTWLVRPRNLLLLGPMGVLADSPSVSRITWRRWGGARAYGVGRTRTKTYDPWTRVDLVAYRVRACAGTSTYTRVAASFTTKARGDTYGARRTWAMPHCGFHLR